MGIENHKNQEIDFKFKNYTSKKSKRRKTNIKFENYTTKNPRSKKYQFALYIFSTLHKSYNFLLPPHPFSNLSQAYNFKKVNFPDPLYSLCSMDHPLGYCTIPLSPRVSPASPGS